MPVGMGMESLPTFMLTWTAMTAAMMAPSALPFVVAFARRARSRTLPAAVLVSAYLSVWALFGAGVYYASMAISLPPGAVVVAGAAVAFVGLYAFTPIMRAGQARCIEMCRRRDPLGESAVRAAVAEGATYGLSCVACSGGVMLALVVLGMSNVLLMLAGSALILLYKVAGRWPRRLDAGLSVAFAIAGLWLVV
jgi:predicted metal-binding membrane protein